MMARHPEIVKRAQEEIDRVIGTDRLPTYEDRPNLPYLECIMKEVFRFNPAVPIGIPHQSTRDDVYRGWTIPGQSMILPNIWCMMRDEQYFPEPEEFRPDRYLSESKINGASVLSSSSDSDSEVDGRAGAGASANVQEDDPSTIVFGFGRRLCPGRHFAEVTVWMTYACFLAAFDIGPYVNPETGCAEPPEVLFAGGTSSNPLPFKCTITPRSKKHEKMVEQTILEC